MTATIIPFAKPAIKHHCLICMEDGRKVVLSLRPVVGGERVWHCRGCGWMGEG